MDLKLRGKTALVSGSTQGIGYAIAQALAGEGVSVTLNGRDEAKLQAAVERLQTEAPDVIVAGITADFAEPAQVEHLLNSLDEVDILVNNVGMFGLDDFDTISDAAWHRYFDVNVMSSVRLSRHLVGGMLSRDWGRIIFVGSESGVNVPADMVHYGVTKAAALALANGLAKLTRGTGVTVNTILGGPTYSDGVAEVVEGIAAAQSMPVDEIRAGIAAGNRTSLLQRFIEPAEIANLALYLASPVSSATNGAALRADGGTLTTLL
jgi:NAD(P)-dependent dehydrogenase (short-subunit alcohol dehydrogenase family)